MSHAARIDASDSMKPETLEQNLEQPSVASLRSAIPDASWRLDARGRVLLSPEQHMFLVARRISGYATQSETPVQTRTNCYYCGSCMLECALEGRCGRDALRPGALLDVADDADLATTGAVAPSASPARCSCPVRSPRTCAVCAQTAWFVSPSRAAIQAYVRSTPDAFRRAQAAVALIPHRRKAWRQTVGPLPSYRTALSSRGAEPHVHALHAHTLHDLLG